MRSATPLTRLPASQAVCARCTTLCVADRIEFILADFCTFAPARSPPASSTASWTSSFSALQGAPQSTSGVAVSVGGTTPKAGSHAEYCLRASSCGPDPSSFALARRITPNVAFYLPRNGHCPTSLRCWAPSRNMRSGRARRGRGGVDGREAQGADVLLWRARSWTEHFFEPPDVAADSTVYMSDRRRLDMLQTST